MIRKRRKNKSISDNNRRTWGNPKIRKKRINGILKNFYGDLTPKQFYKIKIRPLLIQGYSPRRIERLNLVQLSNSGISNLIREFGSKKDLIQWKINTINNKADGGKNQKGKISPLKGKTYDEILGPKRAIKKRNQSSKRMKKNNPRKFITKVSKGQQILFEIIKKKYPCASMEYQVKTNKKTYFLDIVVPKLKLDIEFDGVYWHSFPDAIIRDKERDMQLKRLGWKIYRFMPKERAPLDETLKEMAIQYKLI